MERRTSKYLVAVLLAIAAINNLSPPTASVVEAGVVGDIFKKIAGNKSEDDIIKQSAPVCGTLSLSRPDSDKSTLSPEIVFITNRPARVELSNSDDSSDREGRRVDSGSGNINEISQEFRFHFENVTLQQLERFGFNPDAPVSFLMHGFTSGYPLQTWISAIVESYTITREAGTSGGSSISANLASTSGNSNNAFESSSQNRKRNPVNHNLFVVNWNYAARGILYPRAVSNIPIVAGYITRFINDKLIKEAGVDPRRIQLIGHSLGAHLAGFIGKNTVSKLGRIYGLDPAGPCFGTLTGSLFPADKRLGPDDAEEVITIHTNSALLGIDQPLGKYSVFVEGGASQPGCKGGGVLESLNTLTWDGGSFDSLSCSHSRAPNLFTYRFDQTNLDDDCQLVAYECKDWESFSAGQCGVCQSYLTNLDYTNGPKDFTDFNPLDAVECLRIGLDWQYPRKNSSRGSEWARTSTGRPYDVDDDSSGSSGSSGSRRSSTTYKPYGRNDDDDDNASRRPSSSTYKPYGLNDDDDYTSRRSSSSTYRPYGLNDDNDYTPRRSSSSTYKPYGLTDGDDYNSRRTSSTYKPYNSRDDDDYLGSTRRSSASSSTTYRPYGLRDDDDYTSRRPSYNSSADPYSNRRHNSPSRERRATRNSSSSSSSSLASASERRRSETNEPQTKPKSMFLKTGDTQPYCVYQYQVVLELNEPFPGRKKPPMSLILQDSEPDYYPGRQALAARRSRSNSLSTDDFGTKFNDKTYTHLLTGAKKLGKIDHATLLFREKVLDGHKIIKALHVNYMSHRGARVRKNLSGRFCLVKTGVDRSRNDPMSGSRYFFEPCDDRLKPVSI